MKRILFACWLLAGMHAYGQTTYYWVGSGSGATNSNISTLSNWNTVLNGTGSARTSSTSADILVFDGSNLGGLTSVTGTSIVSANSGITCARMIFTNNADIRLERPASGTTAITMTGDADPATEDLIIDAGAKMQVTSTAGSFRIDMTGITCSGRVSGQLIINTPQQARIGCLTTGTGKMVFKTGAALHTNITGASSYAFGNNSQGYEKWVIFESGAHLYYEGGNSPMASNSTFTPIDMQPGSVWHQRANVGTGSFFNRRAFGDIIVENNSTLVTEGPIARIGNLTVTAGSTFTTHSSGQTVVTDNLQVDGIMNAPAGGSNEIVMAGDASTQAINGSGSINVSGLLVGSNSIVTLGIPLGIDNAATVYGKLSFGTNRITGAGTFKTRAKQDAVAATIKTTTGSYLMTGNTTITASQRGQLLAGAGIPVNTIITSVTSTGDSVYISQRATATAAGVTASVSSNGTVLQTANANGFDPASGSASLAGAQSFESGTSYIIDAPTTWPYGVTTGSDDVHINTGFVEINAPVTNNRSLYITDHLSINAKMNLRPRDTVRILSTGMLNGNFSASNYIATGYDLAANKQSHLQLANIAAATTLPVGTPSNYLPVVITPTANGEYDISIFEGITVDGALAGTAFTATQKQGVTDVVWQINRPSGSGSADVQFNWTNGLEGSTFATLANTDIGLIYNNGGIWGLPGGTADNTSNSVSATVSNFGSFSIGAVPQTDPFVFNALANKIYGNADFNGGATSLNSTQPIIYSSSNTDVATIVGGNIHITGAGVTDITATQASDGFYPVANITQSLTVDKAALVITADSQLKFEGQPNPTLTATYVGLVLNETSANLTTPPVLSTTAVTASGAGAYPITVSGATSSNYDISYVDGILTIQARTVQTINFPAPVAKTYGNPDFATNATSSNTTIPLVLTSSNTAAATIIGNNIHIIGAGTATITASQAGNAGYFPATDVVRTVTIAKATLAIKVRDTTRVEGQPNPPFTITYSGFVLNETAANLTTPVVASVTATPAALPGNYPITLTGGATNNYNVTFTNGKLTVTPLSGTSEQRIYAFAPNNSTLTVRIFSVEPGLVDITLYTSAGIPVMKKNIYLPAGFIESNLNIASLNSGIYFVTARGNGIDLKTTVPIIKQ